MKYKVTIIETVLHEVEVEATDEVEARMLGEGTHRDEWKRVENSCYVETGEVERVRKLREVEL